MQLRLELEEDCTYVQRPWTKEDVAAGVRHQKCVGGELWDYSGKAGVRLGPCPRCHGRGKVLSAQGRELLEVMRFWLDKNDDYR